MHTRMGVRLHTCTHIYTHVHTQSFEGFRCNTFSRDNEYIMNVELIGVHVDILLCVFSVIPSNTHTYCLCYSEKYAPAQ